MSDFVGITQTLTPNIRNNRTTSFLTNLSQNLLDTGAKNYFVNSENAVDGLISMMSSLLITGPIERMKQNYDFAFDSYAPNDLRNAAGGSLFVEALSNAMFLSGPIATAGRETLLAARSLAVDAMQGFDIGQFMLRQSGSLSVNDSMMNMLLSPMRSGIKYAVEPGVGSTVDVVANSELGLAQNAANGAKLIQDLRAAELANPLVESLGQTGKLPANYVTKAEAIQSGWKPGKALNNSVPGGQLGGDVFVDPASIGLPTTTGRIWYEADIGLVNTMSRRNQPGTRLLYSNDGLGFVTPDHYNRLYQLPNWKKP